MAAASPLVTVCVVHYLYTENVVPSRTLQLPGQVFSDVIRRLQVGSICTKPRPPGELRKPVFFPRGNHHRGLAILAQAIVFHRQLKRANLAGVQS
jgi:hypothetical protein